MWFPLLLALTFGSPEADAGKNECIACCKAGGLLGCNPLLKVFADGSIATPEGGAWRIIGMWTLGCDSPARFDPGATTVVADPPIPNEIIRIGTTEVALHCFEQACALPLETCVVPRSDGRRQLLHCGSGEPVDATGLSRKGRSTGGAGAVVAVVNGKPLVLQYRSQGDPSGADGNYSPTGAPTGASGATGGALSTAIIASRVEGQSTGLTANQAPSDPSKLAAYAWKFDLPDSPTKKDCATNDLMKTESKRRVDLGNDASIRGEYKTAIKEYTAAISINRCNAFAWADLGALANTVSRPDVAIRTLKVAVALHPRHYTAWTNLGKTYESFGQRQLASDAFAKALEVNPNNAHARQGLQRTR